MFEMMKKISPLAGRILLSAIFISSGINKLFNIEGTAGYMAAYGMPWVPFFLIGAILFELGGGLSVLFGFKARLGALLLIGFLIPTTLVFHGFWASPADQAQMQMINFMKNLAVMGGLLVVFGFGAGSFSLDAYFERKKTLSTPKG